MLRIFLPLYLILAIFIICFFLAVQFLPDILLAHRVADYDDRVTRGTFHLIEKKLDGLSKEQQKKTIKKLQNHFAYPVRLLEQGDPLLDQSAWDDIAEGKLHAPMIDEADYYIRKLNSGDSVIALTFSDSQSEINHREALGTYYLIEQYLKQYPQEKWSNTLSELQTHFGIPLSLKPINKIELDDQKKRRFDDGKIIALDLETNNYHYIGKIPDSQYALIAGPIKVPITIRALLFSIFSALIIFLAIALYFWVKPLWLSVRELSQTADEFGHGKLNARVDIKPKATLGKLASQFNGMADRIGRLIIGHRELTNAVSHELRTPIARMRFGVDMIKSADTDQAKDRYLQGIETDIEDLENLVDELLTYARFERTDKIENLNNEAIVPWLKMIVDKAHGYIGDRQIECLSNDIADDKRVPFNPRYMEQVIHNLLRNAAHYSEKNIFVRLEIESDQISIHIDDDGSGIPEHDRKKVFEAFSRLDESRDKTSGGYGLGLAIAKRIVEAHKGEILITDSLMGGARFRVRWPI